MRKFLIPLLMASVALPTAASAGERGDLLGALRQHATESRKERSSEDRPQRAERAARPDRSERNEPQVRVERAERPQRIERIERVRRVERIEQTASEPQVEQQQVREVRPVERVRQVRRSDDGLVGGFRTIAREQQSNDGDFTGRTETRRGDRLTDRHRRWSGDWRRDHRYDWRSYRNSHRRLFRLGRYYDPYGWGYRRFSIGFSLGSSYYGSNYWLDDPWMYRLPPAYGPYRWVRYYDDALLVNIYSGQVVDVLYNFFW